MTPTVDTSPLSDAEILHLLRTLAPGVPPGLDQPPLPPAALTVPPWVTGRPARSPIRWLTLAAGSLGLLILWGLTHGGGPSPPATSSAFATLAPGVVYWPRAEVTPTAVSALPPVLPSWTPTPLALVPTTAPLAVAPTLLVPTLPPVLATTVPPTLPPPTATPLRRRMVVPAPPGAIPPTATSMPPTVAATVVPSAPATPPVASGSGAWGNDWSGSIFDRSATMGAPTPAPTISP